MFRSLVFIGFIATGLFLPGCSAGTPATQPAMAAPSGPTKLAAAGDAKPAAEWDVSLDNIEACSCPTFCQCYFNDRPALHEAGAEGHEHAMRYCRFNNAFKVAKGSYNGSSLDGLKFWIAGDLGANFGKGQMDWAVLHFEPGATPEQREALKAIATAIFPVKWNSFTIGADAKIDWQKTDDAAEAKLDDGKLAQIVLKQNRGSDDKPVVLQNVKFWAAPRNSGFAVMTNEIEAYRGGNQPFEFHNTNGFFTRIEMRSADVAGAHASAGSRSVVAYALAGCCSR